MFAQMKKIIDANNIRPATTSCGIQTDSIPALDGLIVKGEDTSKTQDINAGNIKLIHYLMSKLVGQTGDQTLFFNAIVSSYDVLDKACTIHIASPPALKQIQKNTMEWYLGLIFTEMTKLPEFEVIIL